MVIRAERLNNSDVRAVFRLLGEIKELGRDPSQWRLHLLKQLLPLVDARVGLASEHFISPDAPRLVGLVEFGWKPEEQRLFYEHVNSGGMAKDPLHEPVQRLLHRSFTRRRCDLVPDDVWYSSPTVVPLRQHCNVDDIIYSRQNLPQRDWAHMLSLMRPWGAKPFSARERSIVSLLHRELGRLWRQIENEPLMKLPPRLRQALDLILSGYSEKEIAKSLCLSSHTVHDFSRRLYRHFGVSSRGELLGEPACRRLLFAPALSPAYYAEKRGEIEGTFPAPA